MTPDERQALEMEPPFEISSHELDEHKDFAWQSDPKPRAFLWDCFQRFRKAWPTRRRENLVMMWRSQYDQLVSDPDGLSPERIEQPADEFFDADRRYRMLEDRVVDALLTACGVDPQAPRDWPMGDIVFDDYDSSFEFHGVKDGWVPTAEQLAACMALGFNQCWICYRDGTERYCSRTVGDLKPSSRGGPREEGRRCRQLTQQLTDQAATIAQLHKQRDALRARNEVLDRMLADRDNEPSDWDVHGYDSQQKRKSNDEGGEQ